MNDMYALIVFNIPLKKSWTYSIEGFKCEVGFRVKAEFGKKILLGYVIETHSDKTKLENFNIKKIVSVLDDSRIFFDKQIELAKWIQARYFCSFGEALSLMVPSANNELKKSLILDDESEIEKKDFVLSAEQQNAVDTITNSNDIFFYLFGITGSGKTAVFFECAKKILKLNKSIIYLVPEISLTHQLTESLLQQFGSQVAVLHSKLTPSKKLAYWRKIISGEIKIIVGARSAIFAPVENLGLIIIDEEHENSYKSGSTPRYHARQVAMHLATSSNAKLIMGSATPSVESYYYMQTGVLKKLVLSKRVAGGDLPNFRIIDTKKSNSFLSTPMIMKIKKVKEEGGQTILFLNRKGFYHFFTCKNCGFEYKCPNCSIALTYYRKKNIYKCNYCGHVAKPLTSCPDCGSVDISFAKVGTEKLENEVNAIFPNLKIERIDAENITRQKELARILNDFKNRKIDLLLGTQMIAKGLNFPGLKFVGIIDIDSILNMPDFRAAEKGFALITQVAGRTGRYIPDGEVYLQTTKKDSPAIKYSIKNEIDKFYQEELDNRLIAKFPPFYRLIKLVFRSKNSDDAQNEAQLFYNLIEKYNTYQNIISPVFEATIFIINNNFRFQIILKSKEIKNLYNNLNKALLDYKENRNVYLEIDVDPINI